MSPFHPTACHDWTCTPDKLLITERESATFEWKFNQSLGLPVGIAIIKTGIPPTTFLAKMGSEDVIIKQERTFFVENCGMRLTNVSKADTGDYEVRVIFPEANHQLYDKIHLEVIGEHMIVTFNFYL